MISNLVNEPLTALSSLAVGDMSTAWNAVQRFGINSTVGVLGWWDEASTMGYEPEPADIGLSLCRMGVGAEIRHLPTSDAPKAQLTATPIMARPNGSAFPCDDSQLFGRVGVLGRAMKRCRVIPVVLGQLYRSAFQVFGTSRNHPSVFRLLVQPP